MLAFVPMLPIVRFTMVETSDMPVLRSVPLRGAIKRPAVPKTEYGFGKFGGRCPDD